MATKPLSRIENVAVAFTRWIGSTQSLLVHSAVFAATIAVLAAGIFPFDVVILVFNTAVSLEAIYLAIFIQLSVNRTKSALEEVEQDIDEIQEDIDEIQEDVGEIQEDVDEIQEDVEEMSEPERGLAAEKATFEEVRRGLHKLLLDIDKLQKKS